MDVFNHLLMRDNFLTLGLFKTLERNSLDADVGLRPSKTSLQPRLSHMLAMKQHTISC